MAGASGCMRHWINRVRSAAHWLLPRVLALRGSYQIAFAVLLVPALITLSILLIARLTYPRPQEMEVTPPDIRTEGLPRAFWVYLIGAMLVAAGFADFSLISYHFAQASTVSSTFIPVFYAVAMGMGGIGSLLFGRLFDRFGISVLIPLTILSALFAPLVFLGGFWAALIGMILWGLGIGVHESIIPAAVAPMVPDPAARFGLRPFHRGIWHLLVPWQRTHRHPVWSLHTCGDCLLPGCRTRSHPVVRHRQSEACAMTSAVEMHDATR